MLNAKEILEEGLIVLDNAKGKPAQVGYDLSISDFGTSHGGKVFPNLSMCDNIQYDAELYCTNCKCIDEGSCSQGSWKLYQCMGH